MNCDLGLRNSWISNTLKINIDISRVLHQLCEQLFAVTYCLPNGCPAVIQTAFYPVFLFLRVQSVRWFGEWLREVLRIEIFVRVLHSSRVNLNNAIIQMCSVVSKSKVLLFVSVVIFSSVLQK